MIIWSAKRGFVKIKLQRQFTIVENGFIVLEIGICERGKAFKVAK